MRLAAAEQRADEQPTRRGTTAPAVGWWAGPPGVRTPSRAGEKDQTYCPSKVTTTGPAARPGTTTYRSSTLVATGRLAEDEAPEVARDLAYNLAKTAYRL